jgi:nucleoside-diphosphate-sugar epimerase
MMAAMANTVLRTSTAVVGGSGLLASRIIDRLTKHAVAVRTIEPSEPPAQLARALEGAEAVVVLDRIGGLDLDGTGGSDLALGAIRNLFAAARDAGVRTLVVVSSAMVYGARDDNPIPLTEDAPVRPDPGLPYALACAELERLALDFGREDADRNVAVLRPVVVLGPASTEWLRRSVWGRRGVPIGDTLAPRQFVHVDDVASAVELACTRSLDGVYNVAPDGWIAGDTFRELAGTLDVPVPARARPALASLRRALVGAALPKGLEAYAVSPWVVASGRLRSLGWEPRHTSEETFVEADRARGWRALSPRARQELSLGAVGALVIAAAVSAAVLVRGRHRRSGS